MDLPPTDTTLFGELLAEESGAATWECSFLQQRPTHSCRQLAGVTGSYQTQTCLQQEQNSSTTYLGTLLATAQDWSHLQRK